MSKDANPNRAIRPSEVKIVRSFRLSPETVALVQQASDQHGISQGEIIEGCVIEAISTVVKRLEKDRDEKASARAAALASVQKQKRPVGRPRKDAQDRVLPKDHTS